jgi:hypothetical protein
MATREQKEKLVEALKFEPVTYAIRCWGYGGEIVLGTVDRKTYKYFKENDVDLDEYATSWFDDECEVPEEFRPFNPGSWYECDDIAHAGGVEMSEHCYIALIDSNENTVWDHVLEPYMLEESEIEVECQEEYYAFNTPDNIVFLGQSIEKGTFFDSEITLTAPFDPTKLKLVYEDVEGLSILSQVFYNGEEIYNDLGADTVGKSMEFKFLNTGED